MIGNVKVTVLDNSKCCMNGWAGTKKRPACNYTGGHYCDRERDHPGLCRCSCGARHKNNPNAT
jgi:hypothetical protein